MNAETGITVEVTGAAAGGAGEAPMAQPEVHHYTVTFDFNFSGSTPKTAETTTFTGADGSTQEYITTDGAPSIPDRTGYRFAGWDTAANPVLENGVSTTRFSLGAMIGGYTAMMGGSGENGVMEITEDTTLYARWVTPTPVSTEQDLINMKNDLAGWYVLQNDITLTADWVPVGNYYTTYEWLDTSWWAKAFSGRLDGNGYAIKGLQIRTLAPYGDAADPVDGSANGAVGLFGAICNATIQNLTIESPEITISDYANAPHGYVSVIAAFVQGGDTVIRNVRVSDAEISVKITDVDYLSVSGLLAGHWGGSIRDCAANGTISVFPAYTADYAGETVSLYCGGLIGEGYCWVDDCTSEMAVSLTVRDDRLAAEDGGTMINTYMGAIGASAAYTANDSASGTVSLDCSQVAGTPVTAYVGGIAGIQRYGYLNYTETDTAIAVKTNGNEGNVVRIGSLLGGYDEITSILFLDGSNDLQARLCTDAGVTATLDGSALETVPFIGYVPATEEEMATCNTVSMFMGVDLSQYLDPETQTYTIFGTDRCERTGG